MSFGPTLTYSVPFASGATSSSQIKMDRSFNGVYLVVPTMTSNTEMYIQGSDDGTTFRRVFHPSINSSTVSTNKFAIVSGATNCIVPVPNGLKYYIIETSATVDSGCTFKLICMD